MAAAPDAPQMLAARAGSYLRARRHTALLIAIIATFAVRPLIGDGRISLVVFSIALVVMLLAALYSIQIDELMGEREILLRQRKRRSILGWAIALPAIVERLVLLSNPNPRLVLVSSILWFGFFAFVTWSQLRSLLRHRDVTGETISLSISVYLLMGLTWGLFYIFLHQVQPGAFSLGTPPAESTELGAVQPKVFPIFIYFSLTTLATIGYGDITPLSLQARYAAVAEGITGQFYLAILVARLVGMHMSQTAPRRDDDARPPQLE